MICTHMNDLYINQCEIYSLQVILRMVRIVLISMNVKITAITLNPDTTVTAMPIVQIQKGVSLVNVEMVSLGMVSLAEVITKSSPQ